jgi:hypothetical protein
MSPATKLKVRTDKTGDPLPEGLIQLDGYLSRCGLDAGYLLGLARLTSSADALPDH